LRYRPSGRAVTIALWRAKRVIFRTCFENFDYDKVAEYGEADIQCILDTPGMIRSCRKIEAVINNARCFQQIREEYGSFSDYIWSYSGGKTILYNKHADGWIPASNGLSERISKDLKKRGFKYMGEITVYSHLQDCGIINDHGSDCPCYRRINDSHPTVNKRRDKEKNVVYYGDR
ncbi:DNA-3-methyladenine glycosylase I, partial [[Clostridium] scindens]|uniref:DNA-3-methyladenine glycosylase I n=1 Tax=Clostridium scindens (strain JCM 10418 / VPI 12708) TaxID=29347 RepID=UPI00156E56AA